jgi:hypothetical protein
MRSYGIGNDEYDAMLSKQKGVCAICHQPETKIMRGKVSKLQVDHCHATGRVRGLLCHRCNSMLSHIELDIDMFRRTVEYLREPE